MKILPESAVLVSDAPGGPGVPLKEELFVLCVCHPQNSAQDLARNQCSVIE